MKFVKRLKALVALCSLIAFSSVTFGAVTYTVSKRYGPYAIGGYTKEITGYLDLAGTYATGGFALNPVDFGIRHLQSVQLVGPKYVYFVNTTSKVVKVYSGGSEVTNATDISADDPVNFVIKGN